MDSPRARSTWTPAYRLRLALIEFVGESEEVEEVKKKRRDEILTMAFNLDDNASWYDRRLGRREAELEVLFKISKKTRVKRINSAIRKLAEELLRFSEVRT